MPSHAPAWERRPCGDGSLSCAWRSRALPWSCVSPPSLRGLAAGGFTRGAFFAWSCGRRSCAAAPFFARFCGRLSSRRSCAAGLPRRASWPLPCAAALRPAGLARAGSHRHRLRPGLFGAAVLGAHLRKLLVLLLRGRAVRRTAAGEANFHVLLRHVPIGAASSANEPARSGRRPDRPCPTRRTAPAVDAWRPTDVSGVGRRSPLAPLPHAVRARRKRTRRTIVARCLICPASPGRGCGPWTVLPLFHAGADRRGCRANRAMHDNSAIPRLACHVNKKQPFRARARRNFRCTCSRRASRSKPPRRRCRGGVGCDRGYRRSSSGRSAGPPAGVVGGRTDDLAVDPLLDHMRAPAGGARDDEDGVNMAVGTPSMW